VSGTLPPRARTRRGRPAGRAGRAAGGGARGEPTRARLLALRVLERVERGAAFADLALHAGLRSGGLGARDRALATELVCGTLRWRGRLDWLLARVIPRPFESLESPVRTLLRLGAYQIVFLEGVPAPAAVDQAVRAARAIGVERAAGLVNAALRRLAREHASLALPGLEEDPVGHLTHALSLPAWIAERWLEQFGAEQAIALAAACNEVPPRTVRANRRKTDAAALLEALRGHHPSARRCAFAPDGLILEQRGHPGSDPLFLEGAYTVQDEASQLVVELLDPRPGERVLDACAAPGAKATAIAERVGDAGRVVALDRHPRRLGLVRRDARRLGLSCIEAHERDASRPLGELGRFDRVLVDAPCSGLGTLRRNPDARWRIQPRDVERLCELQLAILRQAALVLRPGGTLVYSTCTVLPEENERVIEAFLSSAPDFRRARREELPEAVRPLVGDDGALRTFPHHHGTDAFFAVRLQREDS
jgi:16S rRNA (cytosine967-C5)-methyltransferase